MKLTAKVIAPALVAAGFAFSVSLSFAQQTWAPPAEIAPQATAAAPPAAMPKPAAGAIKKASDKGCDAQADAKGLHKKERKKFIDGCKKS